MPTKRKPAPKRKPSQAASDVQVVRRKLSDYKTDPRNPNKGTERGNYMLNYSVEEFGPARSGVVDAAGIIRAGNHTAEQLAEAGIEDVIEVTTTGKEWVVVKREDMTPDIGKRYAVSDNRTAQVGIDYDADVLREMTEQQLDLSQFFFPQELSAMLDTLDADAVDPAAAWGGMPEFEQDDIGAFHSIKVHFASIEDLEQFAKLVEQTITDKTKSIWYPKKEKGDYLTPRWKDES